MSEMVERVKRALVEVDLDRCRDEVIDFKAMACAAIAAMREPTEPMVSAGYDVIMSSYFSEVAFAWMVMIDAALGDKP